MYRNLEAELVRNGLNRSDLAECLEVSYGTISAKMNGKYEFTLSEAIKIKNKFFSDLSIEYLFEKYETKIKQVE